VYKLLQSDWAMFGWEKRSFANGAGRQQLASTGHIF
jgi:hypothetical protein